MKHSVSLFLCATALVGLLSGCGSSPSSGNQTTTTTGGSGSTAALSVTGVTPSTLPAAAAATLTVTGTGFSPTSTVQVSGITLPTTYVSSTQLTATVAAGQFASATVLAVSVSDKKVTASGSASVQVNNAAPSISGITPASIVVGSSSASVSVAGGGFFAGTVIQVNGSARPTTYVSASQVTVALTSSDLAAAGSLALTAVNPAPGGGTSTAASLAVVNPAPVLSSASATSIVTGTSPSLHLFGSGFLASSSVLWNGSPLTTQFVSATELVVSVDTGRTATTGTASITVNNPAPGGGVSAALSLPIVNPAPVLTSVSPSAVFRSSTSTLITLQGTGFQSTSTVLWNGAAYATTYISATQLSINVAQADVSSTATTATLQVTTPAPGGGSSSTLSVPVYAVKPTITFVRANVAGTPCQQITLSVIGQNFPTNGIVVRLNGTALPSVYTAGSTAFNAILPNGLGNIANPQLTVELSGSAGDISDPFTLPAASAVCVTPSPVATYPGATLAFDGSATVLGTGAATALSLTLPTGFTAVTPAPYTLPTRMLVKVDPAVATGSYTVGIQAAGGSTFQGSATVAVRSTAPSFSFATPQTSDLDVVAGGSTTFTAFALSAYGSDGTADFLVTPSMTGLPTGVTASFQPAKLLPGDTLTVTLTADKTAPLRQNVPIALVGSIDGLSVSASANFTLSVSSKPGTLADNKTAFTATGATPAGVVYDRAHGLVFASNSVWNRIDVISATTHALMQSIPVPSPTHIDISQDNATVWIGTRSQQVFALNTTTFAMARYSLPKIATYSNLPPSSWTDSELYALSNGNLLLVTSGGTIVWSPSSATVTSVSMGSALLRSGDGTRVFGLDSGFSGCKLDVYSAAQASVSTYTIDSGFTGSAYCGTLEAANADGSILVTNLTAASLKGIQLIGPTGQSLGSFTAALTPGILSTAETVLFNPQTFVFSHDNRTLYQTGTRTNRGSLLATYDVASRTLLGLAPAIASATPPLSSGYGGNTVASAVDDNGMLIGIQSYGVAFEDTTFFQDYGSGTLNIFGGNPTSFSPQSGPLSGGTSFTLSQYIATQPDVWFGDIRGVTSLSANSLKLTSPAGAAPGPVDVKLIYPNGELGYAPLGFSYGPSAQQAVYSGSSPAGGAAAAVTGFGMPVDSGSGSVSVGSTGATITSVVGQYPPWTGEAVPTTYLNYTLPAGHPGYADLQVTTPNGTSMLPRAVFYAASVTDYAFSGTPSAVIWDKFHKSAYVITSSSVLVFANGSFQSPISVPTVHGVVALRDAALSVDGNYLLVGNPGDASVAVLGLGSSGTSYALPVPDLYSSSATCTIGPGGVAALSGTKALVVPTPSSSQCGFISKAAIIDYQARTSSTITFLPSSCNGPFNAQVQASADGSVAVFKDGNNGGACVYTAATGLVSANSMLAYTAVSIAGDGNVIGGDTSLYTAAGDPLSVLSQPPALYGTALTHGYPADSRTVSLRGTHLNASGGLSYQPHAGYFDIVDALSNTLRMRFSLTETLQDVPEPLAIDEGGRQIFLLTGAGLTVVDLGEAPLSVGHLGTGQPVSLGTVQLRGSGFDAQTTVSVDSVSAVSTFVDENTLSVSLPALASGAHVLTLKRTDGSTLTVRGLLSTP